MIGKDTILNTVKTDNRNKISIVIIIILCILTLGSVFAILFPKKSSGGYIADIYQNGTLIQSIPLYEVQASYSFEIKGENDCLNVVEVRPGTIAIVSADCPDKLCVHQGAVSNSLLPITCLPNRVVIQLRAVDEKDSTGVPGFGEIPDASSSITPDIITY